MQRQPARVPDIARVVNAGAGHAGDVLDWHNRRYQVRPGALQLIVENVEPAHMGRITLHESIATCARIWAGSTFSTMSCSAPGRTWYRRLLPIKNVTGMTSTGIDDTGNIWHPRRLTLHEVFKLDETFTDPQLLWQHRPVHLRLKRPWNKEPIGFKQLHKIEVNEHTGVWEPSFIPEDWDFSRSYGRVACPTGTSTPRGR